MSSKESTIETILINEADLQQLGNLVMPSGKESIGLEQPKVVIDSRKVIGGEIFVALKGENTDGHAFLNTVAERKASLAIVSHQYWATHQEELPLMPLLVTSDPLETLQNLAKQYRKKFSIPVVALGGNSGKTTTKEMTATVLRAYCHTLSTEGNLNNHIGVPMTLLGLRKETEIAVIEMGMNHYDEMTELCNIAAPTHGLITNIGKAHIEYFGSIENVANAEAELFEYLNETEGSAFINTNDDLVLEKSEMVRHKILMAVKTPDWIMKRGGLKADVIAEEIGLNETGAVKMRISTGEKSFEIQLKMTGRHNIFNALSAAAVGLNFGVSPESITRSLEQFEMAPALKRMVVFQESGITIINDTYNANPESMRAGITALCDIQHSGKKVAILSDMLELGNLSQSEHRAIGDFLNETKVDLLFTIGSWAEEINNAAQVAIKMHFKTKAEVAEALTNTVKAGDALLFKGSRGMKVEEILDLFIKNIRNQKTA
ncbi:MAG: UDP-N-acetylmuramoyl-tripeptide--D-alanyl-D-alanine ligase [Chloroherpetonaceae bacterium]|nr:UDP-N-acetylmuramoyl-tripeptide--D-alanyl-D-alanine ligase [Chloroherpetonaceae bacterium]